MMIAFSGDSLILISKSWTEELLAFQRHHEHHKEGRKDEALKSEDVLAPFFPPGNMKFFQNLGQTTLNSELLFKQHCGLLPAATCRIWLESPM